MFLFCWHVICFILWQLKHLTKRYEMKILTEDDIKSTIANMNASDEVKRELQKQCDKGDQGSRFYVYWLANKTS